MSSGAQENRRSAGVQLLSAALPLLLLALSGKKTEKRGAKPIDRSDTLIGWSTARWDDDSHTLLILPGPPIICGCVTERERVCECFVCACVCVWRG